MRVYEYKGFPNPARVRLALAEKGLIDSVEFVQIDLMAGEHQKPEFLAKNPSGVVPVLELTDGTMLSECAAITEYLDHLSDDPALTGRTAQERGEIHMVQRKIEDGLLDAVGAYFHHATPGLGPDIEGYQNADWGNHRKEAVFKTMYWMNERLEGHEFLVAGRFTIADITAIAGFAFADFAKIEIPEDCVNVKAWRERVSARPSMAHAV